MKKLFAWINKLVNRIVTNVAIWVAVGLLVLGIIAYIAYTTIFVRLPEPPVYATYTVLPPERNPAAPVPTPICPQAQAQIPQPVASPNNQAAQSTAQATPQMTPQAVRAPYQEGLPDPCHPPDQWSDAQRERYYQTSQGSLVIPYAWFRALESRTGTEMFAAPDVQARYGLLPDNNATYNKDQMPTGFVKNIVRDEYVKTLGAGHKEWASISCAACHTGQLTYKGTAMRIDGAQSFWNFDQWSQDLVFSLIITSTLPDRFERFCTRVYGLPGAARCTSDAKQQLRREIKDYLDSDLVMSAVNAILQHTYPTKEGFTRTSALGRGVNGEFGPLDLCKGAFDRNCYRNVDMNTGPVSFPPLWYTHEYDWVQSTTAIRQPLGRNITESWGVNVHVELHRDGPVPQFSSTHNIEDMFWMETLISILQAPKWPEEIFSQYGPEGKIDWKRVERGKYLYNDAVWANALTAEEAELKPDKAAKILGPNPTRPKTGYCARCHAPAFEPENAYGGYAINPSPVAYKADAPKFLQLPLYPIKAIVNGKLQTDVLGTDPDDAVQFASRQVHTGYMAQTFKEAGAQDPSLVDIGTALNVSINGIENQWFKVNGIDPNSDCRKIMEGYRENLFRAPLGYPARPLDGYWATGPFLHNGSVRTIYELLGPASERAKSFWIGSREFDPVHLGFENAEVEGAFLFDTSLKGNSNAGHEFRDAPRATPGVLGPYLSHEDRMAIIEYMKVMRTVQEFLDNDPVMKDRLVKRNQLLQLLYPFYEGNYRVYNGNYWVEPGNQFDPSQPGGFDRVKFCRNLETAVANQAYGSSAYVPSAAVSPSPSPTATPTK